MQRTALTHTWERLTEKAARCTLIYYGKHAQENILPSNNDEFHSVVMFLLRTNHGLIHAFLSGWLSSRWTEADNTVSECVAVADRRTKRANVHTRMHRPLEACVCDKPG
jgi:hypothetical protein